MNSRKRWGWKRRESTSALITQKKKVKKHRTNWMKAQTHEYLQMKCSQTGGRMPELPAMLILGSLANRLWTLMASSATKVERSHHCSWSLTDQHTHSSHVHRVLFVWWGRGFINVMNPFSKSKQKIRKPPQGTRYKAPVKNSVLSCKNMCTAI